MKSQILLTEEKNIQRALSALMKALGPVETIRFLTLPRHRRLDAVRRHRQWQAKLDRQQFFDDVFSPK